jgi:hypothetical protein
MQWGGQGPPWSAKEEWSGGWLSWVVTTVENRGASRLMTGTTWSPSGTARLPPGQKSRCTSTTTSASSLAGEKAIGTLLRKAVH